VLIETIRVQVEPDEGDDLLEALSVRGLASRLVRDDDRGVEVEVSPPQERWELWNLEVVSALEAWLEASERESVVARTDRHEYVVRAPRDATRGRRDSRPVELSEVDDTARKPAIAPVAETALPVGVFAEPQLHAQRPRGLVVAAATGTALLALAGILLLVFVILSLF
jgi:hypothetical protein